MEKEKRGGLTGEKLAGLKGEERQVRWKEERDENNGEGIRNVEEKV